MWFFLARRSLMDAVFFSGNVSAGARVIPLWVPLQVPSLHFPYRLYRKAKFSSVKNAFWGRKRGAYTFWLPLARGTSTITGAGGSGLCGEPPPLGAASQHHPRAPLLLPFLRCRSLMRNAQDIS